MKCIDTRGNWDEIFTDKERRIDSKILDEVCKIDHGNETCRYIVSGRDGFVCVKGSELHSFIDGKVEKGDMFAQGDNCDGMKNRK